MPEKTPLKRNESLKDLSRNHHHALLLCWKIRTGLKKQTDPQRIKKYTDYFYKQHLLPHFELEEKYTTSFITLATFNSAKHRPDANPMAIGFNDFTTLKLRSHSNVA